MADGAFNETLLIANVHPELQLVIVVDSLGKATTHSRPEVGTGDCEGVPERE